MYSHLYELVRERARRYPTAVAVGSQHGLGWKTLTSEELLAAVDALAGELAAHLAVGPGDRVVVWAPNAWQTPAYFFALWKLGAIVVPFDREMNPGAAAAILESVEPRAVIVGFADRPQWIEGRTGVVDWWEPGARDGGRSASGDWSRPTEEIAAIYFTSGTTGNPKGCVISHANLCSQVDAIPEVVSLDPSCRAASILPLSHLFELTAGLLGPLAMGAAIHYVPSRRGPDVVRVFQEQRITHMVAVPQLLSLMGRALDDQLRAKLPAPIYHALYAAADRLPLDARRRLFWMVHRKLGGQLRLIVSGGAALAPEVHHQWERIGVRIIQGYGTSECSPVISCGARDGSTPVGSVGKPLRGVEVRLSPEGELQARGPNVMRGYWKDEARTAEVLSDGWYSTGDLARIDDEGNIWILGRLKDLIVLPSGMKVWPQDVEDVLRSHPAVKDAAVVAVPSQSGGMTLHGYLIPTEPDDRGQDLAAIVAWCNGRLALHQRLATASWWESETGDFPRTAMLKVRRHLLPVPSAATTVKVESTLAADDPVGQAIAGAAGVSAVSGGQSLGELGLDSLGLVELALTLEEKTGKAVADGELGLDMTVDEVRALVAGSPEGAAAGPPGQEITADHPPLWPYTWGRALRVLGLPFDLLYRLAVTRTIVLGAEHLTKLPPRVILAGTHRSYPDLHLVKHGLARTSARHLAGRLVVPAAATRLAGAGPLATYGVLAFGLYRLDQHGEHAGRGPSLRSLARLAEKGNAVLIFPQGRQTTAAEETAGAPAARFKPGVAHLAAALDAAVVPFGLAGSEQRVPPAPPEGFRGPVIAGVPVLVRRGPLAIAFGAPLAPGRGESPELFTKRLEEVCFDLSRQAERALTAARG